MTVLKAILFSLLLFLLPLATLLIGLSLAIAINGMHGVVVGTIVLTLGALTTTRVLKLFY